MRVGFWLSKLAFRDAALSRWALVQARPLCSGKPGQDDTYRQLEKLDFMSAAKILFTEPPKKKKFGLDFHLVQLFFACMPSLAVFLVAQYARYEIRRMEAEVEMKKKGTEETEKMKDIEVEMTEKTSSDSDLVQLKERLDALEVAVKEIVNEKEKRSDKNVKQDQAVKKKPDPPSEVSCNEKLDLGNVKAGEPTRDSVHRNRRSDSQSEDSDRATK